MRKPGGNPFILGLIVFFAAMILAAQSLLAVQIPAGYDYFVTEAGTLVDIGAEPGGDNPPVPQGFFGLKNGSPSDAFSGTVALQSFPGPNPLFPYPNPIPPFQNVFRTKWLDPHGNEVGPNSAHKVQQVLEPIDPFDTIIQRKGPATLANAGDAADIPIEIIWLSLKSVDPIKVTYGAEPSSFFDVYVGLSDTMSQLSGKTRLTATVPGGTEGTVDLGPKTDPLLGLPVIYDVFFIDHNDPNSIYKVPNLMSDFYSPRAGTFNVVPEPATLFLLGLGLTGLLLLARMRALKR